MNSRWWRLSRTVLAGALVLALAVPLPSWSQSASLGTARGVRGIELSWDSGKSWLPLGGRALPILEGTRIRSTTGGAWLDIPDGSRIRVFPFSQLGIEGTGRAVEVALGYGRLTFRLPAATRVELRTVSARLVPAGQTEVLAGELFVAPDGTLGLKMAEGRLAVQELAGRQRALLAALEPVFLPKRPETPGPFFSSEMVSEPPPDARGVYTTQGESLGYLRPDARLVVHPGFTADLTRPFPPKLVQLAMARIPAEHRSDAMPLFDVHGGYVGYVSGPTFYAQAQIAQAQVLSDDAGGAGILEGLGPVGGAVGGPVLTGSTEGFGTQTGPDVPAPPPDGTPLRPVRR